MRPGDLRVIERDASRAGGPSDLVLLLVHGAMDRATSFTRLMAKLPEWRIVAYDRRGYGRSFDLGPPADFDCQVADLVEALGDRRAVAFGHSFGGDVVLAAMQRNPAAILSALVWEPPQPWLEWWPSDTASRGARSDLGPEDRAEWFMRRVVGDRIWERLPASTRAQRRAEGTTLDAELATIARSPAFDPAAIGAPVLVGRGGSSRGHQRRSARELAGALRSSRLVEIPEAGHGAHLTHPAELADLIRQAAAEATTATGG